MDCIPMIFIFGFPEKVKQDSANEPGRMCPRCNNASVVGASTRTWFELCWIPLIPFMKKDIWLCSICGWRQKKGEGYDPQPPGGGGFAQPGFAQPPQGYNPQYPPPPPGQGYQPNYGQK